MTLYVAPGTFVECSLNHNEKKTFPHKHYVCSCNGCHFCEGHKLDCTCDVDWDEMYESKWK